MVAGPRNQKIQELRYFGGLSVEQIAEMLEIAPRSVKRDWSLARIALARELFPQHASSTGLGSEA
jgi:DNA-directed RNA polymerase specialized sigma24 family protein